MERKKFIKNIAMGGSILFSSPVVFNACSCPEDELTDGTVIDLNSLNLNNVGDFDYSGDLIIIRINENNYLALSKICTHQGCTVAYNHSSGNLPCPCHGSVYNISGAVIAGPAPQSLTTYSVRVEGSSLIIS